MSNSRSPFFHHLSAWLPAIVAIAVIFCESTEQFSSANTSTPLRHLWEFLLGPVTSPTWLMLHHHIRKAGHLIGYGLLSGFLFRAWFLTIQVALTRRVLACQVSTLLALASTFLIASADEIHQKFLPSRSSSATDVAIDMAGGLAAQMLIAAFFLLYSYPGQAFDHHTTAGG